MIKINVNGITREMLPEEEAEFERFADSMPPPEPTIEEQVAELKTENAYLREALELILSGATEVDGNG